MLPCGRLDLVVRQDEFEIHCVKIRLNGNAMEMLVLEATLVISQFSSVTAP